ncbi:MAG: 3-mercaptopyruvate sulfurtransferase [Ponticaulis sp.]|nr:3-mercaptopyruvate sulfurtransferase [Ponticaulis sp.]
MQTEDPLVSADWLKEHLDAPDIRVVDASWIPPWGADYGEGAAKRLYLQEHIPGAVFFDIDDIADETTDLPHMIPSAEKFSSRARKLGLGDGKTIIVYDRSSFMASARVWWMLRLFGHNDVKVLDGGLQAWHAADGPVEDLDTMVSERHFTVRFQNQLLKTQDQISQGLEDASNTLLDARPAGRFDGTEPEPRAGLSSGHIPGSVSLPATSLMNPDGTLKSNDQLAGIFGNKAEAPQITASCGSGVSAALILLALFRLGRDDIALYDGAWTEWASNSSNPIEKV